MIGEVSLGGVFVPTILLLAIAALVLTGATTRLLSAFGAYRFVAYRPLVDFALFFLILGLLSLLTGPSL
ncbi:DUF1656 domain-containing protein [Sphingomonas sp. PAMC 26605]|uniref:DUF1656 domain-containing protein n=1 Tax=Sphingomonas sp. PAMC 26605 TaxID=1112214 RepID=UPI00026CCBE2|nr:DUF1656 domain-containing protein [Sphingomonas sp. PAMC 26605]